MVGNSKTTTNGTLYVQGFGLESGDEDIAPRRRSSRLNTTAERALPPAVKLTQKKASDKPLNIKSKPGNKRMNWSLVKAGTAPKSYTRFLVLISQILRDLKDKPRFKLSPPIKGNTLKMDKTKYCAFHRGSGHTINECTIWAINAKPGPIVGFTKQNAKGVDFPHKDALVISVQLAHAIVVRVMVDNGSSVNLLQLSVIHKMGLESTVQCKAKVLTGFNGLTSTTIGTITLDVTNLLIVSSQTFMIVSDPSPHNRILGQTWLVKIGAVTSVEYQKI
ncbi:unnamed protein product [Malus baccata var. baccata]